MKPGQCSLLILVAYAGGAPVVPGLEAIGVPDAIVGKSPALPALIVAFSEPGKSCSGVTLTNGPSGDWAFVGNHQSPPIFKCGATTIYKPREPLAGALWQTGTLDAVGPIAGTRITMPAVHRGTDVFACVAAANCH